MSTEIAAFRLEMSRWKVRVKLSLPKCIDDMCSPKKAPVLITVKVKLCAANLLSANKSCFAIGQFAIWIEQIKSPKGELLSVTLCQSRIVPVVGHLSTGNYLPIRLCLNLTHSKSFQMIRTPKRWSRTTFVVESVSSSLVISFEQSERRPASYVRKGCSIEVQMLTRIKPITRRAAPKLCGSCDFLFQSWFFSSSEDACTENLEKFLWKCPIKRGKEENSHISRQIQCDSIDKRRLMLQTTHKSCIRMRLAFNTSFTC